MPKLTIYQKPTCSTCRDVMTRINAAGFEYDAINYVIEPPSREKLSELVSKMGLSPHDVIRTKDARELGLDTASMSDDELLDTMAANPAIIQRPILEYGDRAVLARPAEKVEAFLRGLRKG